jgi:hypothetical protein
MWMLEEEDNGVKARNQECQHHAQAQEPTKINRRMVGRVGAVGGYKGSGGDEGKSEASAEEVGSPHYCSEEGAASAQTMTGWLQLHLQSLQMTAALVKVPVLAVGEPS